MLVKGPEGFKESKKTKAARLLKEAKQEARIVQLEDQVKALGGTT